MNYRYVDVHCHPNLHSLKGDQEGVIGRMKGEGVLGIVVGVDEESSIEAVRLADAHEHLYACIGLHPNYSSSENFNISKFSELIQNKKVVGVGECGLDFFRQSTTKAGESVEEGWKEKQWEVFKAQVQFALSNDLPLMIHCRPTLGSDDAYEDMASYFESLQGEYKERLRGNMHFFVGGLAVAQRFWALGFTTSFTGVITFSHDYDEVVREAPAEALLTETDAPYATPVPHRGEVNEPQYVRFVTEKIAELRGESVENTQKNILQNAERLFGIR